MRRTVNWRLVITLSVCCLVFVAGMFGMHHVQIGRSASLFLTNAEEAIEEGEFAQAIHSYSLYLRLVPDSTEVRSKMGQLLADSGKFDQAFSTLEEVVRQDPNDTKARKKLVDVALALRRFADAESHLTRMLQVPDARSALRSELSAEDAEQVYLLAQTQQVLSRFSLAAELYVHAIILDPKQLEVYARLGDFLQNRHETPLSDEQFAAVITAGGAGESDREPTEGDVPRLAGLNATEQATRIMRALVDNNPRSSEARLYRGSFLAKIGNTEGNELAALEAARAIELAPEDHNTYLLAARCEMTCRRFDRVRQYAERGRQLAPEIAEWYLMLARVESLMERPDEALQHIRDGILRVNTGQEELLAQLANMLLDRGLTAEGREIIADLRHFDSSRGWLEYLSARVLLAEEKWLAARHQFEAARPYFLDRLPVLKQIDYKIGLCHSQLGNTDQQLIAYRRATKADPKWIPARVATAKAHMASGLNGEALRELRQLARLVGESNLPADSLLDLVQLTVAETRDSSAPNWEHAQHWLTLAKSKSPNSPRLPIYEAELHVAKGQTEEGVATLEKGIQAYPGHVMLRSALAELYVSTGEWERASAVLDAAVTEFGDSATLRLARARHLASRFGKEACDELRLLAEPCDSFTAAESARLVYSLASYALRLNDIDQATVLIDRLSRQHPDNLNTWLLRLDLAQRSTDEPNLAPVLAALDRIQKRGPVWHYARAVQLHRQTSPEATTPEDLEALNQALVHLNDVRSQRPGWAPLYLLAARIQQRLGKTDAAIASLVQAIELGPQSQADVRQTVQMLFKRQQFQEADRLIQLVEGRHQRVPSGLGQMATQISVVLGRYDRALDLAREMAAESEDHANHIWLAKLAAFRGHQLAARNAAEATRKELYAESERALRRATELAETSPEPWVILVQLLHETEQAEPAQQVMIEMQQHLPHEAIALATAQCHEALQNWDTAEAGFRDAAAAASDDPIVLRAVASFFRRIRKRQDHRDRLDEIDASAERYLKRMLESPHADTGQLAWAKREMASINLSRGGFDRLQEAEAWVAENLTETPGSLPDLRLRAIVLSRIPERHREAVQIWEQVVTESPYPLPSDMYSLAKLYEAMGETKKEMETLLSLVTTTKGHPNQAEFVVAYIRALMRKPELSEAETWLGTLNSEKVGRPAIARLQAEILTRRNQDQAAIEKLTALVEQGNIESPKIMAELTDRVSAWLNELGQIREMTAANNDSEAQERAAIQARLYVEAAARIAPVGKLALAAHHTRQHRFDEALDIAETITDDSAKQPLRDVAISVAESHEATVAQLDRVGRILVSLLDRDPDDIETVMAMARLRDIQGHYDAAAEAYRRAIGLHKRNFVAMNNLAMLLVGQKKELGEARQLLERAIQIAGRNPALLDSQALLELAVERPQLALRLLEEAVSLLPTPELFFHQAVAYHKLGQAPRAKTALKAAAGLKLDRLTTLELQMYRELDESLN